MIIIPSLPTYNIEELKNALQKSEGVVDRFSVDIVDGKFADNTTVGPEELSTIETSLSLDYQLMVIEPIEWIDRCVEGKASQIIGHIEHMSSQSDFVNNISERGIKAGLGLDLKSPIGNIDVPILHSIGTVLLMSVPAGFGGQKFDESIFGKVEELNNIKTSQKLKFSIHIDGGVRPEHVKKLEELGVDEVSVGRRLFEGSMQDNINQFKNHD